MLRNKLYHFIIFLLLVNQGISQDFVFKVLANKGQNKIEKPDGSITALKTGQLLFSEDKLITTPSTYIGLMHSSKKTTEIRGAVTAKVSSLEKKINTGTDPTYKRYAKYIVSRITDEKDNSMRAKTQATGGVKRVIDDAVIHVFLPNPAKSIETEVTVRWSPPDEKEKYTYLITIKNMFDEVVYNQETNNTQLDLNFDEIENETGLYILSVKLMGNQEVTSADYGIKKIEMPNITKALSKLRESTSEDSAIDQMMLAGFYEEHGLVLDAITSYEKALQLASDVKDYQMVYEDFLSQNGLLDQ